VRTGSPVVVIEPSWGWGKATEVHFVSGRILREKCTVQLRDGGRLTIFLATRAGLSDLSATVPGFSNLATPEWGGEVRVRPASR
jgi:hypothetical protein